MWIIVLVVVGIGSIVALRTMGDAGPIKRIGGLPEGVELTAPVAIQSMVLEPYTGKVPKSSKASGQTVSLEQLTCDCDDFTASRAGYPQQDVRRVCEHIARAIGRNINIPDTPAWAFAAPLTFGNQKMKYGVKADNFARGFFGQNDVYFGYQKRSPWINVVVRQRYTSEAYGSFTGPYSRYLFLRGEDKWIGPSPEGAAAIRHLIQAL